ncbi:MAG: HAMP domain-containing sensor histidine kinase [Actinomycetota bacterium]
MRLSVRLALVFGLLGLVAVASVAVASYTLAASETLDAIDDELRDRVLPLARIGGEVDTEEFAEPVAERLQQALDDPGSAEFDGAVGLGAGLGDTEVRLLFADGTALTDSDVLRDVPVDVPVDGEELAHDADASPTTLDTVAIGGREHRVLTSSVDPPFDTDPELVGFQLFRDLSTENAALSSLRWRLLVLSLVAGAALASISWVVGRRLARPLVTLTSAVEDLSSLDDVPGRVEIDRDDEIGRLANSFNSLMSALEVGREQQQRLVADASHELRTPLTSLRMRVEYLAEQRLTPDEADPMLRAAVADTEQLSALVSDIVDLASTVRVSEDERGERELRDVVLDVAHRVESATGRTIEVEADGSRAVVDPTMIERAVLNLLTNATKYGPDDGRVLVRIADRRIEVHDDGPGIDAEDVDHVFDRFFRSPRARSRPGNGIGLAIVKHVADAHGGDVWAGRSDLGGARVGFSVM